MSKHSFSNYFAHSELKYLDADIINLDQDPVLDILSAFLLYLITFGSVTETCKYSAYIPFPL